MANRSISAARFLWRVTAALALLAATARGQSFGYSVSISRSMLAVGEPGANSNTGAVFVYQQSGSTWTEVAELTSSDGTPGDLFGSSVSIFNSTVLVGAPGWPGGLNTGSAYVFNTPDGVWTERAELTASDGAPGDYFGSGIVVDLNVAAVGAPGRGATYVFVQPGTDDVYSTQNAELTVTGPALAFGTSISLFQGTLAGGAPGSSTVYGFVEPSGGWANMTQTWAIQPVWTVLLPATLSYANQQVGTSSAAQNVTLTNTGTNTVAISSIGVTGADSDDFSQTNTCGTSLGAGVSCTIGVTFRPLAPGVRTATLSVTDSDSSSAQTVSLRGKGTTAGYGATPGPPNLPDQHPR